MESRAYALGAGLFVIVLTVALVAAAVWLSGEHVERASYLLVSEFNVSGLNPEATVRYRGVEVGKVESIKFDREDPRLILIDIAVDPRTPITRGTYAQLAYQGITGLAYVELNDDGEKPERLVADASGETRIPVRQSFLDDLSGAGKDLVSDASQVARRLTALLSEDNQKQLLRTLSSLEGATHRIGELAVKLEPAVKNVAPLTDDARKAIARAETLFTSLNQLTLELTRRADALERMARSAEQIGGAARSASDTAVAETLPRINALVDELTRTSRNLDRLLTELNEHPASLVFGRPAVAPGPGEPGFNPRRGETP